MAQFNMVEGFSLPNIDEVLSKEDGEVIADMADLAVGFWDPVYRIFPNVDAIVNTAKGIVIQCDRCGKPHDIDLDSVELSTSDLANLVCGIYKILER